VNDELELSGRKLSWFIRIIFRHLNEANDKNYRIHDTQCPDLESNRIFSENNTFPFINLRQKVPSWLP